MASHAKGKSTARVAIIQGRFSLYTLFTGKRYTIEQGIKKEGEIPKFHPL
jgi:hypothetical protein